MAAKLTRLRLKDGTEIYVESEEPQMAGPKPVSLGVPGEVDFDTALRGVGAAAEELFETLRAVKVKPSSCEISFGVKITGSVGAILAKAEGEANFSVTMTWSDIKD